VDRIPQDQRALFRRRLVELVGLESRFSRSLPPDGDAQLALDLGVTPEVLLEAVEVRRTGFRLPPSKVRRNEFARGCVQLSWRLWRTLAAPLARAAERRHLAEAVFVRSVLHAYMQTPYEPVTRVPADNEKNEKRHRVQTVSRALHHVLCTRASVLGVTTSRYCTLLLNDYLAGQLPPVKIVPVNVSQCFDDPALYALPVLGSKGVGDVAATI
jgi:hypothetical protein